MYNNLIMFLLSVLSIMAIVMPFILKFICNLYTDENIHNIFKDKAKFCAICTSIIAAIVYVFCYILFPSYYKAISIPQIIVIGIIFVFTSAYCSQTSYDKVIKFILNIFKKYPKI